LPENKVKWAPSILSADFGRLGEQVTEATQAGADYIHLDVMDGHFVPNITIGPLVVSSVRRCTTLPLDVHLMIEEPERLVKAFADAGADIITIHIEASPHIHRTIHLIKSLGVKAGVSLNPGTPIEMINEIIPSIDLLLVMSVNPGFGGQTFIPDTLRKITRLKTEIESRNPGVELEVDGGINEKTAPLVVSAGARVLVAGAAVFNSVETVAEAMQRLRNSVVNS
jgi:ribulose-phosphate 3-epimerase